MTESKGRLDDGAALDPAFGGVLGAAAVPSHPAEAGGGLPPGGATELEQHAARRLVLTTLAVAAVVAGGIEYAGWQVVYRNLTDPSTVPAPDLFGIPRAQWGLGLVRNFGGAVAVGVGTAGLAALFPRARRRPWRALSAAFALGTTTLLVVLAALTAWAP